MKEIGKIKGEKKLRDNEVMEDNEDKLILMIHLSLIFLLMNALTSF